MSKRFGRNQRRKMRERIAQLEAQLRLGAGIPQRGDLDLEDIIHVIEVSTHIDDRERYGVERDVSIRGVAIDPGASIISQIHAGSAVAFRGGRYAPCSISPDMGGFNERVGFTLALKGVR